MYSIIFIVLASICKAIKDTLDFHYHGSVFDNGKPRQWLNPNISWHNKYKEDLKTPRFFGSTTFLVMFTDGWHLFDFLQTIFVILAIVLYSKIFCIVIDIVIIYLLFTCIFEVFFRVLKYNSIER